MRKSERVLAALNCEAVDRTPVYDLLCNDNIIRHCTGKTAPADKDADMLDIISSKTEVSEGEQLEGLEAVCKTIAACMDMTRSIHAPAVPGVATDEDGFVTAKDRWTSWIQQRPFTDVDGLAAWVRKDIARKDLWQPTPEFVSGFRRRFRLIQDLLGDDTVQIITESGVGLDYAFHRAGWELFSYLLADYPSLASDWLESIAACEMRRARAIADRSLSPVVLTYGDIAYKGGTLFSPAFLRKEFFPKLKKLNEIWHGFGFKCLFHSDGNLMEVMRDLLETGIDGLNPIETNAGMTIADLRKVCPDKFFLAGGIDVSQLMAFGKPDEVRRVCRQSIEDAGRGYFIGSTTELHQNIPAANILAMMETARQTPVS